MQSRQHPGQVQLLKLLDRNPEGAGMIAGGFLQVIAKMRNTQVTGDIDFKRAYLKGIGPYRYIFLLDRWRVE
jgi:hypothetical protein